MVRIRTTMDMEQYATKDHTLVKTWEIVESQVLHIKDFLEFEGYNTNGHLIPGTRYIYEIDIIGLNKSDKEFDDVIGDLNDLFPDHIFEVV